MLSPVLQRKTSALFKLFDTNDDGYWERGDFEQFVQRMGEVRGWAPDSPELKGFSEVYMQIWDGLQAVDADGDGRVTLDEALAYQEENFTPETVTGFAQMVFPVLDADGDGEIGLDEYRQYLETSSIDPGVADEMFTRLDVNGDGRITKEEWEQLFREYFLSEDPDARGNWLWGPF